jgi:hypothetical protein
MTLTDSSNAGVFPTFLTAGQDCREPRGRNQPKSVLGRLRAGFTEGRNGRGRIPAGQNHATTTRRLQLTFPICNFCRFAMINETITMTLLTNA